MTTKADLNELNKLWNRFLNLPTESQELLLASFGVMIQQIEDRKQRTLGKILRDLERKMIDEVRKEYDPEAEKQQF